MSQETFRTVIAAGVGALVVIVGYATFGSTGATATADPLAGVAVQCGPAQQAVVHRDAQGSGPAVVECVPAGAVITPSAQAARTPVVETRLMQNAAYAPAAYAPAAQVSQPMAAAPAPRTTTSRTSARNGRSWKERALVIGGAAGAGAGVGGITGGKKGALIGAAIGGGGAALFEALKGRDRN